MGTGPPLPAPTTDSRMTLYFHTLRHLRPVQVANRVWRHLYRPSPSMRPPPPRRPLTGPWTAPASRAASMPAPMTFRFLNETRPIARGQWNASFPSDLWRYNLHYFDDLNAQGAQARRDWHAEAIEDWISGNPPAAGAGWDAYPTSLRIVNWTKWALGGALLSEPALRSLAIQARALRQRLEFHLLGNHLLANAKALVFAGLFFEGEEADQWLHKGMSTLADQLPEQILADGGHFERSTLYHALALEDVLDLINVGTAFRTSLPRRWLALADSWPDIARRMRAWLSSMLHPDGEISFFNDAATGVAPSPAEMERYAGALIGPPAPQVAYDGALRLTHLADSGYLRLDAPDVTLLLDAGALGPDYLLGHAHADTLSFELSAFGQRVIVNGGTSTYTAGAVRDAERGTAAHSTVTVDGVDSSKVWASFRVARRAKPFDLQLAQNTDEIRVQCAHDGYRRLPGKPVHRRSWRLTERALRVEDRIEGRCRSAVARFHLHPDVAPSIDATATSGQLCLPNGRALRWRASGTVRIESSHFAPEFGRRLPARCLALQLPGDDPAWLELAW